MLKDHSTGGCMAFFGYLAATVIMILADGLVLSILWRWFINPTFTSAPKLSIVAAIGICIVVSFLTSSPSQVTKDDLDDTLEDEEKSIKRASRSLGFTVFLLFVGWVVHFFM